MNNPVTATAPQDFVNMLFEQEKLPTELGWQKSEVQINFATLAGTAAQVLLFANEEQLDVTEITESEDDIWSSSVERCSLTVFSR